MKNFLSDRKKMFFAAFAVIELAIYITFIVMQALGNSKDTIEIKYIGILLCLFAAAVSIYFYGKDGLVVTCALVFTAIADMFILVRYSCLEAGLVAFIATQTVYFVRIYLLNGRNPLISLGVRLGISVVCIIIMAVIGKLTPLVGLVAVYLPMLVINAIESGMLIAISGRHIVFFLGLLLFVGCDVCVGLFNASMIGVKLSDFALSFVSFAIWVFYLPSQVLIALSTHKAEYKPFFGKSLFKNEE